MAEQDKTKQTMDEPKSLRPIDPFADSSSKSATKRSFVLCHPCTTLATQQAKDEGSGSLQKKADQDKTHC